MNALTRLLAVAVATALAVAIAGAFSASATAQDAAPAPQGPPPAPVSVAKAEATQFAPLLWAPASVVSREDARVASEQDGRVTRVAEVGTQVQRGDPLAQLDDSLLRLQERQNLAELERIQARLDYAHSQEQRLGQLIQKHSIAGAQHDEARSQRRVLEQELQGARVTIEQTRHRLRNATVRAPFDGTVVERFIQTGEYLGTGMAVVRLVNTGSLEVKAQAPVNLAARLAPGMDVTLRAGSPNGANVGNGERLRAGSPNGANVGNGERLRAGSPNGANVGNGERPSEGEAELQQAVRAVVPVGDESSRQFELRITLDSARWPIGSALQVGLPSAEPRDVIAVPRDALVLRANETFVVRVKDDDTAQRVPVRTGTAQGELIEVIGDIAAGDRLVVRGGERIAPGQKVKIDAAQEAPALAAIP